ncbi:hypothetical protein MKX01_015306, partial [Papaver californicum]
IKGKTLTKSTVISIEDKLPKELLLDSCARIYTTKKIIKAWICICPHPQLIGTRW